MVLWAGIVVWALALLPSLIRILPEDVTYAYADMYSDVAPLLAVVLALVLAFRATDDARERGFWLILGLAVAATLAIRATYAALPATQGIAFDLTQDLLYLATYMFLALALERRPDKVPDRGYRARLQHVEVLGALVFGVGLLAYFVLIPSVFNKEEYASWVPSLLFYSVLDGYLVLRTASILRSRVGADWVWPFRFLLAAFALWLTADVVEALLYLRAIPWIDPGTPFDLLWHLPALALFLTVRSHRWPAPEQPEVGVEEHLRRLMPGRSALGILAVGLPVIHFALRLAGVDDPASEGPREILLLVSLLLLTGLLVYHQHLMRQMASSLDADRKLVADQLHIAQRMEAVGRLASGVAHDFSNILSVIRGRAELLLMSNRVLPDAVEDVQELVEASRRGQSLVTHLLTLGRRKPSDAQVFDLGSMVDGLSPLLERVLPDSIDFKILKGDGGLPLVLADHAHLEQVILNLVVNARDAMPAGGALTVCSSVVEIDDNFAIVHGGQSGGTYTVLRVEDTGPGVPDEQRELVFEPFFTTKDEDMGTGLGLSIVYGIARQARGFVTLTDAPRGGAVFEVYFPRAQKPAAERAERSRRAAVGGRETILLVEDYEALRRTAARVLESAGYRVLEAGSAAEALAILERRNEHIQLLVADLVLPDLPGLELESRALARLPHLSTVFISGYPEGVTPLRLPEDITILEKPFSPEVLTFTVRRVLDERKRSAG